MKKLIATIITTIFIAVAANAQTNAATVSLENAINVNFGKGTALTSKAANAYTQAVKSNNDKSFNMVSEVAATPYVNNITVPVKDIMNILVQTNAPCYIASSISIAAC